MKSSSEHTHQYQNGSLSSQDRAKDLVSQMTLEEKISQMVHGAAGVERLGIPEYNWWNECLHGVGRAGLATVFPQAIGLAATWNPELMYQVATAISDEARAKHHEALCLGVRQIYSGLTFWSPNINLVRDPRWGRGQETYGEDPYLTSAMGVPFVKALQGEDPSYLKLVATLKHYAVHSGPESLRHRFDARVSQQDMRDYYLPAFEACVREAKPVSVMGAYNRVNGEPCCASPTLLEQILRQEWGFDGYVVSDCAAISDIYLHHKVKDTAAEAAALAVTNGCELNCGETYPALLDAVDQGLISEESIDDAVTRLYEARIRLGMFDPPEHVPYSAIPYDVVDSAEHRAIALEAARESIVLLKNQGDLLPLSKKLGSVAVIGPNAHDAKMLVGNYNGTPSASSTPLEGIRAKVSPETKVYYAQGCTIAKGVPPLATIPSAQLRPEAPSTDGFGLSARYYANPTFAGEPAFCRIDREVDFTWNDTSPISDQWAEKFSIQWRGYLVPPVTGVYQLGVNGFQQYRLRLDGAIIVEGTHQHHPIRITREVELEAGRLYRLELDYLNQGLDPQIQLLWSLPDVEYESQALDIAEKADVIIAVMGLSPSLEGEEMPVSVEGFAGGDRTDIKLPGTQEDLLKKLQALGKPVVLVLLSGSALSVTWAAEHIPAIVEAWYPGQAAGEAIADILFGDFNPAGKLPVTFYKSVTDLPHFEDYRLEGHTYRYFQGEALFPFGYGLSYTTFQLDKLRLDRSSLGASEWVAVSLDVTNSGQRAGSEVIQLYARQPNSRAIKQLIGFERLHLAPGQSRKVTITVHATQLGYYDEEMGYVVGPGEVQLMAGTSSQHLPLKAAIQITGQKTRISSAEKRFFSETSVD